jgi:hypothetical protein
LNEIHSNPIENTEEPSTRRTRTPIWLLPLVVVSAWAVPGLGHGLLGRWGRGAAFFIAVGGLALAGFSMRGFVFPLHSNNPLGTLGYIADAASGVFYFAARLLENGGPDISRAAGDLGTRFIAAAGVVNLIAIVDVLEIVGGRRG